MASTYSTNLGLELMANDEKEGEWGEITNENLNYLEQSLSGYATQAMTDGSGANTTITIPDGAAGAARNLYLELTGTLSFASCSLIVPAKEKLYFIYNNTTGGHPVQVKVSGLTGVAVVSGEKVALMCNGTDVVRATTAYLPLAGGTLTGALTTNGQIVFPATQNASTNANTLDDYEEAAVATAILTFGGGSTGLTYNSRPIYATKIGREVYCHFFLWINQKGSSTGNAVISGLPYTEFQPNTIHFDVPYWQNMSSSLIKITGRMSSGTIQLFGLTAGAADSAASNQLTHADFANNCIIGASFHYPVS